MKKYWNEVGLIYNLRKTGQVNLFTDTQKVKIRAGKHIDRYTKSENQGR